jgi:hypothetical protein
VEKKGSKDFKLCVISTDDRASMALVLKLHNICRHPRANKARVCSRGQDKRDIKQRDNIPAPTRTQNVKSTALSPSRRHCDANTLKPTLESHHNKTGRERDTHDNHRCIKCRLTKQLMYQNALSVKNRHFDGQKKMRGAVCGCLLLLGVAVLCMRRRQQRVELRAPLTVCADHSCIHVNSFCAVPRTRKFLLVRPDAKPGCHFFADPDRKKLGFMYSEDWGFRWAKARLGWEVYVCNLLPDPRLVTWIEGLTFLRLMDFYNDNVFHWMYNLFALSLWEERARKALHFKLDKDVRVVYVFGANMSFTQRVLKEEMPGAPVVHDMNEFDARMGVVCFRLLDISQPRLLATFPNKKFVDVLRSNVRRRFGVPAFALSALRNATVLYLKRRHRDLPHGQLQSLREALQLKSIATDVLEVDGLSLGSLVHRLGQYRVVISCHGAQLSNIVFMNPGALVIEVRPPGWQKRYHYEIFAKMAGCFYESLCGNGSGEIPSISVPMIKFIVAAVSTPHVRQRENPFACASVTSDCTDFDRNLNDMNFDVCPEIW